jgi:hypothetical protein
MKRLKNWLGYLTPILGFASSLSFIVAYFIFETLRPKMVRFQTLTAAEENLMNFVGIGLLLFLAFCLLSLWQLVRYLKNAQEISLSSLLLLAPGVLGLLLIFGDIALLNDIGKQYRYGLSQPEWLVLYIVMAFQFVSALVLTYANLFKLKEEVQVKHIARDSNIFMVSQYIGLICGSMGLAFISLNFFFPRSLWMMKIHTVMTTIVLLIPYLLIVTYWFIVKLQEKPKEWYDEKQVQDVGRSSLLTLILSTVVMSFLFFLNYNHLSGVVSVLWFQFYAFLVLSLFSLSNLYYSKKN